MTATYSVCGVKIATLDPGAAAQAIIDAAVEHRPLQVHLCNAYTLSLADADDALRRSLVSADLNLPDGTPVAWLGRKHGVRRPVRGPDLMRTVIARGVFAGVRHYFYGGHEGVAEQLIDRLRHLQPEIKVAGYETPPFHHLQGAEVDALAARISDADADIVWVGLGTPQQDHLVSALAARVATVLVPVGAAFDFLSERVAESPAWLRGTGLEWSYRLMTEPRRLWRRYLFGNPRFLLSAWRHARSR